MANKSILIGDAGGTKTDWILIKNGKINRYKTNGFNAYIHSIDNFKKQVNLEVKVSGLDEVYLYCAGADTQQQKDMIARALSTVFNIVPLVENDLLGAARATCGNKPGYVGIIGTGSNASYYDGGNIKKTSASLGYILGDEGSGAYLGKQLLKSIYREVFDDIILSKFYDQFNLPVDQAIQLLYETENPNQYLASFVPFIAKCKDESKMYKLIYDSFQEFFKSFLKNQKRKEMIHFVGSVAFYFSDILRQVAHDLGFPVGTIIHSPIEGLVLYHQNE